MRVKDLLKYYRLGYQGQRCKGFQQKIPESHDTNPRQGNIEIIACILKTFHSRGRDERLLNTFYKSKYLTNKILYSIINSHKIYIKVLIN